MKDGEDRERNGKAKLDDRMEKMKRDAIDLKQVIGSLYKPKVELRDVADRICSRIAKVEKYWERTNKEPRKNKKKTKRYNGGQG